jgi:hypothetical protein
MTLSRLQILSLFLSQSVVSVRQVSHSCVTTLVRFGDDRESLLLSQLTMYRCWAPIFVVCLYQCQSSYEVLVRIAKSYNVHSYLSWWPQNNWGRGMAGFGSLESCLDDSLIKLNSVKDISARYPCPSIRKMLTKLYKKKYSAVKWSYTAPLQSCGAVELPLTRSTASTKWIQVTNLVWRSTKLIVFKCIFKTWIDFH